MPATPRCTRWARSCGTARRRRRRPTSRKIATGELRLQAFGVTEPDAGTDTTRITTFARKVGDKYVVNGRKLWISRAEHSDLMVLLCRTSPRDEAKTSAGMSVLPVDMRESVGNGLTQASLMVDKAAAMFEAGEPCGTEANMAKLTASEASWFAADMCLQTHGGFGFAEEYDIERKFRETRLYQVAPISTNLILSHVATHVLGQPKSF